MVPAGSGTEDKDDLASKLKELEQKLKYKEESNDALIKEIVQKDERISHLEDQVTQLETTVSQLNSELEMLLEQLDQAANQIVKFNTRERQGEEVNGGADEINQKALDNLEQSIITKPNQNSITFFES